MPKTTMLRNLLHLSWPVLIAQLAVMANGVIDTVMAGQLSAIDLAAVGIGASIYIAVFVSVMGILLALTPTVAHLYGGGRYLEIGEEVRQSAWLALVILLPPTRTAPSAASSRTPCEGSSRGGGP